MYTLGNLILYHVSGYNASCSFLRSPDNSVIDREHEEVYQVCNYMCNYDIRSLLYVKHQRNSITIYSLLCYACNYK